MFLRVFLAVCFWPEVFLAEVFLAECFGRGDSGGVILVGIILGLENGSSGRIGLERIELGLENGSSGRIKLGWRTANGDGGGGEDATVRDQPGIMYG